MSEIKETNDIKDNHFNKCWKENANLNKLFTYSEYLTKFTILKRAIYCMMAGFFIGITYLVYFLCKANLGNVAGTIIGCIIFPFAIFCILYMGGNLFTSNTLMFFSVLRKKYKWYNYLLQLVLTWIFNFMGSLLAMGIAYLMIDKMPDVKSQVVNTAIHKLDSPWYSVLASGFFCNVLVVGSVYVYNVVESKTVKFLFVYLAIVMFALSGFQHSVANQFAVTLGVNYFDDPLIEKAYPVLLNWSVAKGWGAFFIYNEPLVSITNVLSGVLLPMAYMISEYKTKKQIKSTSIEISKEERKEGK